MFTINKRNRCMCKCNNCRKCKDLPVCPVDPQLANSYVPYQYMNVLFEPCEALVHGTMFPELVSPYEKNQSQRINNYLSMTKTCEEVDNDGD